MIATVLGIVEDLPGGVIDAHAHVWIDPVGGADPARTFVLNDERAIVGELVSFASAGGGAVVDCQPPNAGRNLQRLAAISRSSGVAVVASSGFHMHQYYGADQAVWELSESGARELFERDLNDADGTGLRAGIVKAAHPGTLHDGAFRRLLAAACQASLSSGVAMQIHTEQGRNVEALADLLESEGADPQRVILSHMDKRPDLGLHLDLGARGYLLEYDTFLRPKYRPEANVWPLLSRALDSGLAGSIACGLDLADPGMWRFGGGEHGMAGLVSIVAPGLRHLGADEATLQALLGGNISRRLALKSEATRSSLAPDADREAPGVEDREVSANGP